jgi:hypothetical protein
MGGPDTYHSSEYGEPGFKVADVVNSVNPDVFTALTEEVRARQAGSTVKFEWTVRAADTTVLSWELLTANGETTSTMEFVLRRGGVIAIPEVRASVQRIHEFLKKEQLHTVAEGLLELEMRPVV